MGGGSDIVICSWKGWSRYFLVVGIVRMLKPLFPSIELGCTKPSEIGKGYVHRINPSPADKLYSDGVIRWIKLV